MMMAPVSDYGYDAIWQAVIAVSQNGKYLITIKSLQNYVPVRVDTLHDYMRRWNATGVVAKVGQLAENNANVYRLVKALNEAPRGGRDGVVSPESAQKRIWRACKILKKFTITDILITINGDGLGRDATPATIKRYLQYLISNHYIKRDGVYYKALKVQGNAPKIVKGRLVHDG